MSAFGVEGGSLVTPVGRLDVDDEVADRLSELVSGVLNGTLVLIVTDAAAVQVRGIRPLYTPPSVSFNVLLPCGPFFLARVNGKGFHGMSPAGVGVLGAQAWRERHRGPRSGDAAAPQSEECLGGRGAAAVHQNHLFTRRQRHARQGVHARPRTQNNRSTLRVSTCSVKYTSHLLTSRRSGRLGRPALTAPDRRNS